jgi:glycosyltransferase involved in cell wall biosynthesis
LSTSGRERLVLLVMPVATERGGAEATLMSLLRHGGSGVRWLVAFLEFGPMVRAAQELGAEVVVLPAGRVRDLRVSLRIVKRLAVLARSRRPDAVIAWMTKAQLYAAPAARVAGVPMLWFQHGTPGARDPIDRVATLLPASSVLAPSRTVAAAQRALWPHRRVHVAYPGVELEPREPDDGPLQDLGIPAGAPVVGMVARLQRWKGVHVLLQAMPAILAAHPAAHAVVVGGDHPLEPGYRAELEQTAARLAIAERVHLVGYRADSERWMTAFDVVVHASDNEPFGLVPLEAMALGKPLVAGAAGGPAEFVRDGVDGFLVAFGDSRSLADRVSAYLGDPGLRERTGRAALTRAREFSASRFAEEVLAAVAAATP